MFGIIRPCRNRLGDELRAAWMAHLCGMCLALRDEHGHLARLVTNYDAVVVSALVEAQTGTAGHRRTAGPCALRGMRPASVAAGAGARLAASVSLLLASAKITDHVADGDIEGVLRARAARTVAARFARAGTATAADLDLDGAVLLDVAAQQQAAEAAPASVLDVTAPTEAATALAFGHTAVVAGRPGNQSALIEIGTLFGRLAHLLDAVEDQHADHDAGAWNPISALTLPPERVRALCDDALLGIQLALRDVDFADRRLVHVLLVHELRSAVDRTFAHAGNPGQPPPAGWEAPPPAKKSNPVEGCLGWLVLCGTCQVCCASEWVNPCTGARHEGVCRGDNCDCSGCDCDGCGDCCDCCDCCDCSC